MSEYDAAKVNEGLKEDLLEEYRNQQTRAATIISEIESNPNLEMNEETLRMLEELH